MTKGRQAALLAASAAVLAGCGGSGDGSSPEGTTRMGDLVTRIVGTAQPPVTAAGLGSVVTAVAGANVTGLQMTVANPTLADTRIAFYRIGSLSTGLHLLPFLEGGGVQQVRESVHRGGINGLSDPCWSPDGREVVVDGGGTTNLVPNNSITDGTSNTVIVSEAQATANPSTISVVGGDGSVRSINTGSTLRRDTNATWWPARRIAFESFRDKNSELYAVNPDGTGLLRLTNNAFADTAPSWSPDGGRLAFVSNRNGFNQIFTMLADGTSQTLLIGERSSWDPQFSPDGSRIAYVSDRDGNTELYVANADGTGQTRLTFNTWSEFDPTWSPDGRLIAYTLRNPFTGIPEIWAMNADGSGARWLVSNGARPSWSPMVSSRTFLGTGGVFGPQASGFLYGRRGDTTTSLLVFRSANATTARVNLQTPPGLNAPNFVFDVQTGDAITGLQFSNDFFLPPVTVLPFSPEGSSVTGAIVDFNASTGKVSAVLPYTANRGAQTPPVADAAGARVYRRRFVGIWDADGRNVAPHGASEARFDPATGKLLSFR